jgi:hypothetical protein
MQLCRTGHMSRWALVPSMSLLDKPLAWLLSAAARLEAGVLLRLLQGAFDAIRQRLRSQEER